MEVANGNSKQLFHHWVVNCSAGEVIGIGVAGIIAVLLNKWLGEPQNYTERFIVLFAMLLAGAAEGTSIAWFQWKALRHVYPAMRLVHWWEWTVTIALLGWALGMLPSLFFISNSTGIAQEPSTGFMAFTALAGGALAGALFGWFQSFELRKHTTRWYWWIGANAAAWSVAMLIIFMGATWPTAQTPVSWIIVSALISGCLAGLSLGVITGWFLVKKILDKDVVLV